MQLVSRNGIEFNLFKSCLKMQPLRAIERYPFRRERLLLLDIVEFHPVPERAWPRVVFGWLTCAKSAITFEHAHQSRATGGTLERTLRSLWRAPARSPFAAEGNRLRAVGGVISDTHHRRPGARCRGLERNIDAAVRAFCQRGSATVGLREIPGIFPANFNFGDVQCGRAVVCQRYGLNLTASSNWL